MFDLVVRRFQDDPEVYCRAVEMWSAVGHYGSQWGRKIDAHEYSRRIHVSFTRFSPIMIRYSKNGLLFNRYITYRLQTIRKKTLEIELVPTLLDTKAGFRHQ